MEPFIYPKSPVGVSPDLTRPSAAFKANVLKVTLNIVLFILLYIVLLSAGALLAAGFGYLGFLVILNVHNLIAIAFGAGLIGVGIMVLFFLVKFLFASKNDDVSNKLEATEGEYPELFAFIRRVSEETGTPFPRHIFITPEVNASVSYDSNLWSLFFKVPKNLTIGLGLVNMINLSEFKAILAHEFGHFSQESMRAGTYVYQANKVIYNLLYENQSYSSVLVQWAEVHYTFAFCARITASIVQGIQRILQEAYKMLNKSYMSLSREMEFHADAVAAKVGGGNNLVHALRRVELADTCYNNVLQKYNSLYAQNYKGTNLYAHQHIAAGLVGEAHGLKMTQEGLPLLHDAEQHYASYNRVNIDNQWASHPTRQQREEALIKIGVEGEVCEVSPWVLFRNSPVVQQELTEQLYKTVQFKGAIQPLDDEILRRELQQDLAMVSYPAEYMGYYDGRVIEPFDLDAKPANAIQDIEAFYSNNKSPNRQLNALQNDMQLLDHVADKKNGIRYFDLDGTKYKYKEATTIRKTIANELHEKEKDLKAGDAAVFAWYLQRAEANGKARDVVGIYEEYFKLYRLTEDNVKFAEHMFIKLREIYGGNFTVEQAKMKAGELEEQTTKLQALVRELLTSYQLPDSLTGLLPANYNYFGSTNFKSEELEKIVGYLHGFANWNYELRIRRQKTLLEHQLL